MSEEEVLAAVRKHPRWTARGAPLDLHPASAAIMAAEEIIRDALLTADEPE
ncbi:hypothetical protein M1D88_12575 [Arthrobacter sp. R1-13]